MKCLYSLQPDVIELRQAMTPHMVAIQMAVLDIMKACVMELKRSQPSVSAVTIFAYSKLYVHTHCMPITC